MNRSRTPQPTSARSTPSRHRQLAGGDGFALLVPDRTFCLRGVNGHAEPIRLRCTAIEQRNWSRVGVASAGSETANCGGGKLFVKQYVDRGGRPRSDHWSFEQTGTETASDLLGDVVCVPTLRATDEGRLLNAFDYMDIVPLDEVLRTAPALFRETFPSVLVSMRDVLETMARGPDGPVRTRRLPVKERPYGGASRAVNFKGFDVRNVGLLWDPDENPRASGVAMFDFGRAYLAPIEEAAAKLFVSIGLLNWGNPLRRFLIGPDFDLLAASLDALNPYLDADAVGAELALQAAFRQREAQGRGPVERSLKRVGIGTVGRRYLRRLRNWCSRHVR